MKGGKLILTIILAALLLFATPVVVAKQDTKTKSCDGNKKVTICHIPPGNPANAHEITISECAVNAHIRNHGDTYGPCPAAKPVCGDNVKNQKSEQCDGTDTQAGYTCTNQCKMKKSATPTMSCEEALAQGKLTGTISTPDAETAKATVTNTASSAYKVSFASYMMYAQTVQDQQIYDYDTATVGAQSSLILTIQKPYCATQLDLVCGDVLQTNPQYGTRVIDYEHLNQDNLCIPPNSQGNVQVSVAPYYPQGRNYVFYCKPDFTATSYSWYFGDNSVQLNSASDNVYHSYANPGTYTVSCKAMSSTKSGLGQLSVTVS
jgi:hypothetical protein